MDLRDEVIKTLVDAKIRSPRMEADIIIRNAAPNYPIISDEQEQKIREYLYRRINHEPLDKIIGKKEFYKYVFKVNGDVLSPRPDTEILVESALRLIKNNQNYRVIDLGLGSGCILLSILMDKANTLGVGVDISPKALDVAKENAKLLNIEDRISFINDSWVNINTSIGEFDIIVSNPPYIPRYEVDDLDIDVKKYDPELALVGGDDGLDCYREISQIAPQILKKDGYILLEVGYNQANDVSKIFCDKGFELIEIVKDLSNINRCVILKK